MSANDVKANLNNFTVERIFEPEEDIINGIVALDKSCFPEKMQYADAATFYPNVLSDKRNILLVLKKEEKLVGCLLAQKYKNTYEELIKHDPEMEKAFSDDVYYIDTIAINPYYQNKGGFSLLAGKLLEESIREKVKKFYMHVRATNGLSMLVQSKFGAKKIRTIDNWFGFDEPFDCLELAISSELINKIKK